MDKFFLCCFITSMICSIESGLIYAIITTKSPRFYNFLDRIFKFDFNNKKTDEEMDEREMESQVTVEEEKSIQEQESLEEFKMVEKALEEVAREDNMRLRINVENQNKTEIDLEALNDPPSNLNLHDGFLQENKINKVIDYDDKRLYLSPRQQKIDELVNLYLNRLDTVIRIILPIVFFSYITYIFSLDSNT